MAERGHHQVPRVVRKRVEEYERALGPGQDVGEVVVTGIRLVAEDAALIGLGDRLDVGHPPGGPDALHPGVPSPPPTDRRRPRGSPGPRPGWPDPPTPSPPPARTHRTAHRGPRARSGPSRQPFLL